MKLSISEARKRLPELVRQVRKDAGAKVEITVRDEVVAEIRGATRRSSLALGTRDDALQSRRGANF
jgi:antitoxin (DNA-binding transcriptional repressor) of toxin-antitoxin stability system